MLVGPSGGAQVINCLLIDREVTHGCAVLRRHVGDGGAVSQRQFFSARTIKFNKLAHYLRRTQHLGDCQRKIRSRNTLGQLSGEMHAHDIRCEEINWLTEHAGLGLNAAHAPADHAKAVDHCGMRVSTDQGIRVVHSIFLEDSLS